MLKYVLMGLLAGEPRYGYELKAVFDEMMSGTWPLNIGQLYSTMSRLERDGLVRCEVVPQDLLPDRKVYFLTEAGIDELRQWESQPVESPLSLRDEVLMKVVIATLDPDADLRSLLSAQRKRHLQALAEMERTRLDGSLPEPTSLLVEAAVLRMQADLEWLSACERRLGDRKDAS